MPTIPPIVLGYASVVALAYGIARVILLRLRARRHRRCIREDLEQRKCQLNGARRRRRRLLARAQTYDIEYTDPDQDIVNAVCTVDRRTLTWSLDDGVPGLFNQLVPTNLPEYGQNWRG